MAMVGRAPTLEEVVPGYSQARREGVSEVLQEALLSLAAPVAQVAKVPAISKLFLQALKKKRWGQDTKAVPKQIIELAKMPQKEWARLRGIGWNVKTGGASGEWSPAMETIGLHPKLGEKTTPWHEFTHKRQWLPEMGGKIPFEGYREVKEEVAGRVIRLLDQHLRARTKGFSKPIEQHARNVAATMVTGSDPSEFDRVYRFLLGRTIEEGQEKLGSATQMRELWEQAAKWAAREGVW